MFHNTVYYLIPEGYTLRFITGLNVSLENINLLKEVQRDIMQIFDRNFNLTIVRKMSTPICKEYLIDGHIYIVDFSRL